MVDSCGSPGTHRKSEINRKLPMADFTQEQRRIISRIDRALKGAHRDGLSMRVFDGAVLMLSSESLEDPRYGEFGEMAEWVDECTQRVGSELNADGGAGR